MYNSFLGRLEHAAKLSEEDRTFILRLTACQQKFGARQDIISEGQSPRNLHILMRGLACLYKQLADGDRQLLAILVPGDMCDFGVQILGKMHHNIGAITATSIVSVRPHALEQMTSNVSIYHAMLRLKLVNEATLHQWLINTGKRTAAQRLAHLLCELHFRLLSVGLAEEDRVELPLTQRDLSEALGLTPVHVNRMMQQLRDDGLIQTPGRHWILFPDYQQLAEFAGFDAAYLCPNESATHKRSWAPKDRLGEIDGGRHIRAA